MPTLDSQGIVTGTRLETGQSTSVTDECVRVRSLLHSLTCFDGVKGTEFHYEQLGRAIPPPKDRLPSGGNYKEMQEGVMPQPVDEENAYQQQEA